MVDQGVVVVIAGGNAGEDGPFYASNGASGKNVLTVGSADPGVFPAQAFSANFTLDDKNCLRSASGLFSSIHLRMASQTPDTELIGCG